MACAPYPIAIRVGNVSLSNSKVARGMNMSIGEPAQPLAFLPLWPLNSTFLYGTDGYCLTDSPGAGSWTDTGCTTFRGGAYDSLASKTRTEASADDFPYDGTGDPVVGGANYPAVTQIADVLRLNDNVTLEDFPMGIAQSDWGEQAYSPMMAIGLGTNSTILNTLKASGKIASRCWAFFWGKSTPGATSQLDGSVVFGGYDRSKTSGEGYTQPLSTDVAKCPSQIVVTISDMILNFSNGTDASIFSGSNSTGLTTCITPGLPTLMRLPLDPYVDNLFCLTQDSIYNLDRSVGIYYWNLKYSPDDQPYDGDLTITLQSGLSTRIPNQQLVMSHTAINQTTGDIAVNASSPDLAIDSLQGVSATDMPQLGWQFFTSAYLMVNMDAGSFTLWNANPTADEDLVAVDATGAEVSDFCATASGTASSSSASASAVAQGSSSSSHVSGGLIGGVVVAAVAVVGILAGLAVWYLRRHRRRKMQTQPPTMASDPSHSWPLAPPKSPVYASELEGAYGPPPQEVSGDEVQRFPRYSTRPAVRPHYELPG